MGVVVYCAKSKSIVCNESVAVMPLHLHREYQGERIKLMLAAGTYDAHMFLVRMRSALMHRSFELEDSDFIDSLVPSSTIFVITESRTLLFTMDSIGEVTVTFDKSRYVFGRGSLFIRYLIYICCMEPTMSLKLHDLLRGRIFKPLRKYEVHDDWVEYHHLTINPVELMKELLLAIVRVLKKKPLWR